MRKINKSKLVFNSISFKGIALLMVLLTPTDIFGQADLSEEFLSSLPEGVAEQIRAQNEKPENEVELDALFRADTTVESNKKILESLKDQLQDLEARMSSEDANKKQYNLERFGENFFNSIQSSFMPINIPNIDSEYILDVGDQLRILLTGSLEGEFDIFIERAGNIFIPQVGSIQISGKSYRDAERAITDFIAKKQIGADVSVSLTKLRDVQIVMLGDVKNPGIYTVSGGSNPLTVLNAAGGILENGSYRMIEHRRAGEVIQNIDLYKLFAFGNFDFTTQMRSGDVIFVRSKIFDVPITGGTNRPAIYELMPGETLLDLINFSGGFSESFYGFEEINVERRGLDFSESLSIGVSELSEFKLGQRDSVLVPYFEDESEEVLSVSISGMVNKPGKYNFVQGETLSDVIRKAGGYKSGAYIFGGLFNRKDALDKQRLYAEIVYSDTINFLVSNLAKPNINVDSSAASLLIDELKSQNLSGRLIAEFDLDILESDPSKDLILQDGDSITIPPLQKVVYLFGDFNRPTILQFNSSYTLQDYIKLAGGTKDSATNDILLISPNGETSEIRNNFKIFGANKADIYPGSIIYVPRNIGQISGITYAATVAPVLSSLAISLASLNSISD